MAALLCSGTASCHAKRVAPTHFYLATFSETAFLSGPESLLLQENQRPTITGQSAISIQEDQAVTLSSDHLLVSDPDDTWPTGFTIAVGEGENYSVAGLTVTPIPDFSGTLSIPVTVNDGELASEPFTVQVTVEPVNDKPVITAQQPNPLVTRQDQPFTITAENLVVSDPDNSFPSEFTIAILPGENYASSGQTVTPATGYAGPLTVLVTASDPVASSDPFSVSVTVTANSRPVVTGQTPLSTPEDTPFSISLSNLIVTDSDNAYPADFTFTLQPGNNYTIADDVISPARDFEGTLLVPVVVHDGVTESEPYELQITVTGINDAPAITGQVSLSTSESQTISVDLSHLTVVDPDNSSFTLSIMPGDNYTVAGNQVTPATGFSGVLTVGIFVSDGIINSNVFNLLITVNAINDPPVITGQRTVSASEGSSLILSLEDVTVSDPDNTFPQGFSLAVQPGENYTFSGNTVTPSAEFSGLLTVNIVVNDGTSNSATFPLQITITPVNDAPIITGQSPVSTSEETPRTISLADLNVADSDNAYPTGFSLQVFPGQNYLLADNTVTPAINFSGDLVVPVQVSDGILSSNIFDMVIQVTAVNDKPVITAQVSVQTAEDVPVTIQLSHLTVLDPDNSFPAGFTLEVMQGSGYSVSGTTVQPALDFNGTLDVPVVVNDGATSSDPFIFQIQVGVANDAPAITGQATVATNEETPIALALSHLTVVDPDNPYPAGFTLLVSEGANYTVSGTTISPVKDFSGVLVIPVRVHDGVNNSPTFNFQLQVNQINDPPSFAPIENQQVVENAVAGAVTITQISKGPMEGTQQLTLTARSSNTAIIENLTIQYDGNGSSAVLTYAPKPNASGTVGITVLAVDNGPNTPPHQNSYSATFQVEVTAINTAPTLDARDPITIAEDSEQQNISLTGISAGAGENQAISVSVSTAKSDFFELLEVAYTSPEPTALLQFKTRPNVFGTADIVITVTDNGLGIAPHVNTMNRTLSVVVQPVNDPPVFTSKPITVAAVGEDYHYEVTTTDPDGENLAVTAPTKPGWLTLTSSGSRSATLHGRPPGDVRGPTDIILQVKDASSLAEQRFELYVNVRPVVEPIAVATEEDNPLTFPSSFFESGYKDADEHALQGIKITGLPGSGNLALSGGEVVVGDTITASELDQLVYTPLQDFFGSDSFEWDAIDGYHFSGNPVPVNISIIPVNDAPRVVFREDTLHYEVEGEPAFLAALVDIVDPDDDTLSNASVTFQAKNYRPQIDILEFQVTANIRGAFDVLSGTLAFDGVASLDEYRTALRSIRYLHLNTFDPILEPKTVLFQLSDGETQGGPDEKVIMLQYTFIEFDIPTGFTPNGDQANDTWVIDRPGGGLEEMDNAVISIYNKQGVLVYRAKGFDRAWDGTMNGDPLPADSYFFTIDLRLRNKKTYKGIVTILR